ncbi:MAG: YbaY family lipoprotein [Opitutales bacterium]
MKIFTVMAACGAVVLAGCTTELGPIGDQQPTMTGSVVCKGKVTLPPTAVLTVRLLEVTRADAPAVVLADRSYSSPGDPPIAFALPYPVGGIDPARSYRIEARIEVTGRLRYYSMQPHVVTSQNAAQPHEVWVEPAGEN